MTTGPFQAASALSLILSDASASGRSPGPSGDPGAVGGSAAIPAAPSALPALTGGDPTATPAATDLPKVCVCFPLSARRALDGRCTVRESLLPERLCPPRDFKLQQSPFISGPGWAESRRLRCGPSPGWLGPVFDSNLSLHPSGGGPGRQNKAPASTSVSKCCQLESEETQRGVFYRLAEKCLYSGI